MARRAREVADAQALAARVLAWFDRHGRHDLPWQKNPTPYRVWVSEIMLQQTQVATVIGYFDRFMQRFPDVRSLADAPVDDVLHLWTGLGYYARARNLHRAAREIVSRHDGAFPRDIDALATLPGIGRSTAGAILALASDIRAPILDGNVKRVLARHHAVAGDKNNASVLKTLWQHADAHTPRDRVRDYTQAMMDLGATLCTRTKPRCDECPLAKTCLARAEGNPTDYPGRTKKARVPVRSTRLIVLRDAQGRVLLEQRPASGLWGGLWCLPQCDDGEDLDDHIARRSLRAQQRTALKPFRHTFSHFHLDIRPLLVDVTHTRDRVNESAPATWVDPAAPGRIGLAAPVVRLLASLGEMPCPAPSSAASTRKNSKASTARRSPAKPAVKSSSTSRKRPGRPG